MRRMQILILKLQRELDNPRVTQNCVVASERRRAEGRVRNGEVRMVEEVEEFGTELQPHRFVDGDVFPHVELPLLLPRTAGLRDVPAKIAKERSEVRASPGASDRKGI